MQLTSSLPGANQGIGLETAKNLLLDNEAYHVILGIRDLSKGEAAVQALSALPDLKGTVSAIKLDVTDDESVDAAAAHVKSTYGRLDILVNNAGIFLRGNPREVGRKLFGTNVVGYLSVTEAFLPLLKEAPAPRIVFVTSSLGSFTLASDPKSPLYAPLANEYRAATAARNMLLNQYWVRLQIENPGLFKVHGADPGLVATNLADSPDLLRKRGAVEPDVGGARIASVVKGDRDADVGRVCSEGNIVPW
ncbi:putative carbonyl reductase [Rhexocercosporidium sp. MPI-PUGE-AT-0058]|nr:putative carbonyl reductase [Rhexocercosporidium sp. MPI-PUGE-AT-0058]